MTYIITVQATDSRSGTPVAGAFVTVTFHLRVDLPPPIPKTGYTGQDGRVSWNTSREGLATITATHQDYKDWASVFSFSPASPTANIAMQNLVAPQKVVKRITCTEDATGFPLVGMRVAVDWKGVGGRHLESKLTDTNGDVVFQYWPSWAGTFTTTFKLPSPTPLVSMGIYYPPEGGNEALSFFVEAPVPPPEEKKTEIDIAWDALPGEQKIAQSVLIALSIIYGMRAIQGFSAQRFSPL